MPPEHRFLVLHPRATEDLVEHELAACGANALRRGAGYIEARGPLAFGYRARWWSRVASRVVLVLHELPVADADALYDALLDVQWDAIFAPERSFSVGVSGRGGPGFTHSRYVTQRIKDAVVDQFLSAHARRPEIALKRPDVRLHAHLDKGRVWVGLDLAGESLHRRGYRSRNGSAPLKENVAAALLYRARWPTVAAAGGPLVDPMCGSGTIVIEAALMALRRPLGPWDAACGVSGWRGHDPDLWQHARLAGRSDVARTSEAPPIPIACGWDADADAVAQARANAQQAGVADVVEFSVRDAHRLVAPGEAAGVVVTNPPYGERLGSKASLEALYNTLGERLRRYFGGWRVTVLTDSVALGRALGLKADRRNVLDNGSLACIALSFSIFEAEQRSPAAAAGAPSEHGPRTTASPPQPDAADAQPPADPGAQVFANRLRKNHRRLAKWARRQGVFCYRVYDADVPEYAFAIDIYEQWVHLQEYRAPSSVAPSKVRRRRSDVLRLVPEILRVAPEDVVWKLRQPQKGKKQYQKLQNTGTRQRVREGGLEFWINLTDRLDVGLFLDHRITRQMIAGLAAGKDFLNLFGYTGTATVYAAQAGARTTTVDLSKPYLEWARDNLVLNGLLAAKHQLVHADCMEWLASVVQQWDVVFVDPPTFSSSKQAVHTFDVQRDHAKLLQTLAPRLRPRGVVVFSTNRRRFTLGSDALAPLYHIEDITAQTIPKDFERNPRAHQCWRLTLR